MEENQKEALLQATIQLLEEASQPEKITSRQIASCAGVNAAMINYYYTSKDALVAQAVTRIINDMAKVFEVPADLSLLPKKRLRRTLIQICQIIFKYQRYTKVYIPHLLLEEEILLPLYILPEIKEHFKSGKSDTECRIIAYQMVTFLQLTFYRSDAFMRYTGIDLYKELACEELIDWELEQFLK